VIASLGKFVSEIYEKFLVFGKNSPKVVKSGGKWGKVEKS
jgi:hypothetical protein